MGFIPLPVPVTILEAIWMGIGMVFGRAFGKKLDFDIQQSEWFIRQPMWLRGLIRRLLDFLHHWWMGAFLGIYFGWGESFKVPGVITLYDGLGSLEITWFGWGLFYDDFYDIPRRVRGYFEHFKTSASCL